MARLASQAKGAYYPTAPEVVDAILQRLRPPVNGECVILDPAAGMGLALLGFAQGLGNATIYAVELSEDRAAIVKGLLDEDKVLAPADFFRVQISNGSYSLIWNNPPFDANSDGRVELQFARKAIGLLVEGAKTVAEGAGAAGLAALLAYPERFRGKKVGIPVTGGNIDARILSNVLLRDLLRDGRLLRLHLQIPDRPGVLADIAGKIGDSGGNIIEVSHQRLFAAASVQAAELEVMVEARDPIHANAIVEALERSYIVRRV